ncbi:MAG TPA: hypothetical protein VF406_10180 [Thermodesulfobacteriota bacterium]
MHALALLAALAVLGCSTSGREVRSAAAPATAAPFDIVRTVVMLQGEDVIFRMEVRDGAGGETPRATGALEGSRVYAYVWPTTLDTSAVGFEAGQGILALAVTFHPDFDDAADGRRNRDVWHTHWFVLVPDEACGPKALKVRDIPQGATPRVPRTWPGVALLVDSPDLPPTFVGPAVEVRVPRDALDGVAGMRFDGITAGFRVSADLGAPLLCMTDVFDVASGDLSFAGRVTR